MHRWIGIGLVALSAAGFGTLALFSRYAYADGMDAFSILFLRFTLAALVMAAILVARREPLPRGRALALLVAMGAVGYIGQSLAYLTALQYASSGLVALLLYVYPVFVMLLAVIFLRERLTGTKIVVLVLALSGVALTVDPAGGQTVGMLLALTAAAIYAIYIMVGTQALKQVSAIQSSTVIFAAAGATGGVLMLLSGPRLPQTGTGWAVLAAIVLLATVLPVTTFLAGLTRIGPTNAALWSTLEPVVTVLLGVLLLGETLRPITLAGGALILVAVLVLTRSELRRPAPETPPESAPVPET